MTRHFSHKEKDKEKISSKQEEKIEEHKEEGKEEKMITISRREYDLLKEKQSQDDSDRILRLQADFENVRKRLERDRTEFIKFANEQIIGDLIPFVDDFQRAFEAADRTNDFNVLHKGVEMILDHLLKFLKDKGVSAIESQGKPFNPAFHEALMQVESDEHPENTVIEELQKGYLLNNRVLRTSKVKVTKNTELKQEESTPDENKFEEEGEDTPKELEDKDSSNK